MKLCEHATFTQMLKYDGPLYVVYDSLFKPTLLTCLSRALSSLECMSCSV